MSLCLFVSAQLRNDLEEVTSKRQELEVQASEVTLKMEDELVKVVSLESDVNVLTSDLEEKGRRLVELEAEKVTLELKVGFDG